MKIANRVFKTPFLQTKTKRSSFGQFYGGNNWKSLGLWSPVLSGVLFDTDTKPYVKEIKKKDSGEQSQSHWPCGDAMMVYSFACGAISTEIKWSPVALFLGSVSDPIFLSHSHLV